MFENQYIQQRIAKADRLRQNNSSPYRNDAKKTISKQQIKGVATDSSSVHFDGQIVIPHGSQNCDGMQNHRGILLSEKAVISATPQLEIWADDVKCAHGSAIGPLAQDQLFYLETRGVHKDDAQTTSSTMDG